MKNWRCILQWKTLLNDKVESRGLKKYEHPSTSQKNVEISLLISDKIELGQRHPRDKVSYLKMTEI